MPNGVFSLGAPFPWSVRGARASMAATPQEGLRALPRGPDLAAEGGAALAAWDGGMQHVTSVVGGGRVVAVVVVVSVVQGRQIRVAEGMIRVMMALRAMALMPFLLQPLTSTTPKKDEGGLLPDDVEKRREEEVGRGGGPETGSNRHTPHILRKAKPHPVS